MYLLCRGMDWAHLPVPGGIYAQDPKFLDDVTIILSIEGRSEKEKAKKREDELEAMRRKSGGK